MMPTAAIELYCPPMPIRRISSKLHRTAAEPMEATIHLPDRVQLIAPVTIKETDVNWQAFMEWEVARCVGEGENYGNKLRVELPPEQVEFQLSKFSWVALKIVAKTYLTLADGSEWEGFVTFPDCKSGFLGKLAEAVTATGTLTQTVRPR